MSGGAGAIVLLDTSVYLNVLDVPGFNQARDAVWDEFEARLEAGDSFLLPLAVVWETGNHIAHLPNGGSRREYAQRLVDSVREAVAGEAPFRPTYFPDQETFLQWLGEFPDHAMRSKSETRMTEGGSLADLSLIREWHRTRRKNPKRQVLIWSLDMDLQGYDSARPAR